MKEANIQTLFGKQNKILGVFELKLCKSKSIRWDSVAVHQIKALSKAKNESLYHKISDFPMFAGSKARFNNPKPFDCLNICCDAYVVVCFYIPRVQKKLYYIDIDNYLSGWKASDKKSYREEEAEKMASYTLNLKNASKK
jgi:hypothetical protein